MAWRSADDGRAWAIDLDGFAWEEPRGAALKLPQDGADLPGRWVNGTLGIVRELHPERVRVALAFEPGDVTHDVEPVAWDKIRYVWNERTKRIEKEVLGRYVQLPLMLAWSTTIHKAQGQTLGAVEIDLGHGAFAPGQAYVALSRCRELSGITLTRAIRPDDVKCDPAFVRFYGELRRQMRGG